MKYAWIEQNKLLWLVCFAVPGSGREHRYIISRQQPLCPLPRTCSAGDMTYIPTREGWLYLVVVLDLFSRRIAGRAMVATTTRRWPAARSTWNGIAGCLPEADLHQASFAGRYSANRSS